MKITVSIFLTLSGGERIRSRTLSVREGATVQEVMDLFQVSHDLVWLYVANHNTVLQPGDSLKEGDHLMVFPPMEGG